MTDFYCDHGVYTSALGTTPTWGVPQEGDGSTKDAATASSVASVDLTSITSTAGTFSIFGSAAISVGASASGATLAAQIVSAINGSTQTTGNTSIFPGAPQLRNAFFARNTGATLEIMCRIGTALTNVLGMTWAGTWSAGPPSNLTFSGGFGGCWGWFFNGTAIGVSSSIDKGYYGVLLYKPYAGAVPGIADTTYVRTQNGKTITFTSSPDARNRDAFHQNLVFDTNTKWTGDSGTGVLTLTLDVTQGFDFRIASTYTNSLICLKRGNFVVRYNHGNAYSFGFFTAYGIDGAKVYAMGLSFVDYSSSVAAGYGGPFGGSAYSSNNFWRFEDCDYLVEIPRTTITNGVIKATPGNTSFAEFIGCTFNFNISGASDPGGVVESPSNIEGHLVLRHCQFLGYAPKYKIVNNMGGIPTWGGRSTIIIDNCSGIKLPGTYLGLSVSSLFSDPNLHLFLQSDEVSGQRLENTLGVAEWVPTESPAFPTLSASRPGSGVPWSLRLVWMQAVGLNRGRAFAAPALRMYNQLSSAVRTLTLEVFVPSGITEGLDASFSYIDSTGAPRNERTETLVSSGVTWTNAGSFAGYVSKKFVVTTSYAVAANSEIVCVAKLIASPASSVVNVYLDPEFTVA